MSNGSNPRDDLAKSLERVEAALSRRGSVAQPPAQQRPTADPVSDVQKGARGGLALASVLLVVAFATGQHGLLVAALGLLVVSGVFAVRRMAELLTSNMPAGVLPRDPTRAHIGMGASVAGDAIVEPGATIEMGATVGSGAVIRRGAVVRMGSDVHRNAVIEENAVVSWGATVGKGAVVGEGAVVGAGSTVVSGAHLPPRTSMMPGSTWGRGIGQSAPQNAQSVPAAPARDPREARIDAACDRIEAELRDAPEQAREYLGASVQGAAGLRTTCHALLRRERALREEASAESLAYLDQERATLQKRVDAETDEVVRNSLRGAISAIDEQKRQRELLRRNADRLDAELTRLLWTLEGMGTQLVRLRTAGAEAAQAPDPEVVRSMRQLHDEIDAIADALEQVAHADRAAIEPHSAVVDVTSEGAPARNGNRTRE